MHKILGIGILVAFGIVRIPIEEHISEVQHAAHFNQARMSVDMRQRMSQMGFLAALSGFRAAVADVLWIQAYVAWEHTEWGKMKLLFDTVTSLQPRGVYFWENASWHMAYNASQAALEDRNQPREALRLKAQQEYFKIGEDYLLRGIANNPDRAVLWDRLGMLYRDKMNDHAKAAWAYENCAALPDAPQYASRFAAYEMAKVPGREKEAYDLLSAFYIKGKEDQMPTLIRRLREMEEKLNIPPEKRIPPPSKSEH